MTTEAYKDGEKLKALIKNHNYTVRDVATAMGWGNDQSVYYYYKQEKIKRSTIKDILKSLKIPVTEFYPEELMATGKEDGTLYLRTHQGSNLEKILRERDMNIRKFAAKVNVSHTTLYDYFTKKELDPAFILLAAKELHVPAAQIKGIPGEKSFEKDIYEQLHLISDSMIAMNTNINRIMAHMGL